MYLVKIYKMMHVSSGSFKHSFQKETSHLPAPVKVSCDPKAPQKIQINEFLPEPEIEFSCSVGLHNKSIKAMNKT